MEAPTTSLVNNGVSLSNPLNPLPNPPPPQTILSEPHTVLQPMTVSEMSSIEPNSLIGATPIPMSSEMKSMNSVLDPTLGTPLISHPLTHAPQTHTTHTTHTQPPQPLVRPSSSVIWNTAPFFNKHNITPRVNNYVGLIGEGVGARDRHIMRAQVDQNFEGRDPVRERAVPMENLVMEATMNEQVRSALA